ncbi:MAG: DUF4179 domain-containing protein [Bacillota bacterium]|nr:DUF4179 domain-containing protein [Bacillota bacterium]
MEDMLSEKKLGTEVPEELETRLHNALQNRKPRIRIKNNWQIKIAAVLVVVLLAGFHSDTLANFGKMIIGYDQVMNGTLNDLNEMGKGQVINESYTSKTGIIVTLDGIMLDDNQLIAFYSIQNPSGNIENISLAGSSFEGEKGRYDHHSGQGMTNTEKSEESWVASYEVPPSSEKNLSFCFSIIDENPIEDVQEPGKVSFILDRNKAMGHSLKKGLHDTIKVDNALIRFKSIVASPTSTVVKGSIQNIFELAWDYFTKDRIRPYILELKLIADGQEIAHQSGNIHTDRYGITFEKQFDALPTDLKKLQIELVSFRADYDVHQQMELNKSSEEQSMEILGQHVVINKVWESEGDTYINITSEGSVILSKIYLMTDGRRLNLEETIADNYAEKADGAETHTRTLHFTGTAGNDIEMHIDRISYTKTYNQIIDIPVD